MRLQHVMIEKLQLAKSVEPHYAVVSKMLFASHFFRAGLEFSYVYPVRTAKGTQAVYFFIAARSYVDGLTGFKGSIVRKIVDARSPGVMVTNLELAKEYLTRQK